MPAAQAPPRIVKEARGNLGKYIDSVCRLCRRQGVKLFLKGDRCFTPKCAIERRTYGPGQHGQLRKKLSAYAVRLREKQKLRRIYGLLEKQFSISFKRAERTKGMTGENLLSLLERRLDNVVFRMAFASSRNQARQLVNHRHILVNGKPVNIPSYMVDPGDKITLKRKTAGSPILQKNLEAAPAKRMPSWIQVDFDKLEGTVLTAPKRQDIDTNVDVQLVVEFYSR